MIDRITEIRESFAGVGAEKGRTYPTKELLERCEGLQTALRTKFCEITHAECFRDMYVKENVKTLAENYGLLDTPCFKRLYDNLKNLGYVIGSFKRGANGERECQKALRTFAYDPGVKFLCNIALENEDGKTEYDAIVIAPYGLFIIEVKKWAGPIVITEHGILKQDTNNGTVYGLAERMNVKKDVLRRLLGDKMPDIVQPLLVFPDMRTEIDDQYHKIPYCIGGGYPDTIRTYKKFGNCLSNEAIEYIYATLQANHKEQMSYCSIDCATIIEDYATLMAQIEMLAREAEERPIESTDAPTAADAAIPTPEPTTATVIEPKSIFARFFNQKTAANIGKAVGAICIALPAVVSLTIGRYR